MMDSQTSASIAAVAVAAVAFCVALSQVVQQYASSGQLIRLCDSVVYGGSTGLPGRGRRVYQFAQFRFRIIYDVPVFSLPPVQSGLIWNALPVSANNSGVDVTENEQRLAHLSPSPRVGEASWVSFCRKALAPCHDHFVVTLVKADADRCPPDLPNVTVPVSLRDVAIMAFAMGMNCSEASFTRKTISMQGPPGSLGSSHHPILGPLIHFISRQAREAPPRSPPWRQWIARLFGLVPIGLEVLPQGSRRGRLYFESSDKLLQELRNVSPCEDECPKGFGELVKTPWKTTQDLDKASEIGCQPNLAAWPTVTRAGVHSIDNEAMSWYWMCQMNVFQGAWATPWKQTVNGHFCIVAYTLVQGLLATDNVFADHMKQVLHNELGQLFEYEAPSQSAPPFARTFANSRRRTGIGDATWSYSSIFDSRLPPLVTLVWANISFYDDERTTLNYHATIPAEVIIGAVMKLDYWLTCAAGTNIIFDGETKILRKMPAIVDFVLDHAVARFKTTRELKVSRFELLLERMQLSHAERVYSLVAMLRTLMVAACIGVGQDTLPAMDILDNDLPLTNDDGPPSPQASPYVATLVEVLERAGHTVSVVLPSTQRSWIGKAHLLPPSFYALPGQRLPDPNEQISETCTPSYYDPSSGTVHTTPPDGKYWVLVPGTPATCAQLGIFHYATLFPKRSEGLIDLVLSGPNYGRNTSAAFALSSGTIGGALEAAVCGIRGIALSFAFTTRQEGPDLIREACEHGTRITEKLCKDWRVPAQAGGQKLLDGAADASAPDTPDLYSINVPLRAGISTAPTRWTWMLDNKWPTGSLYKAVDNSSAGSAPGFTWAPSFTDMWKIVDESPAGNDGLTVRQGETSITPLRANFMELYGRGPFTGEFKL